MGDEAEDTSGAVIGYRTGSAIWLSSGIGLALGMGGHKAPSPNYHPPAVVTQGLSGEDN